MKKNHSQPATSQNGFTLLETALYIGASAIIILGVSVFLTTALKSRAKNTIQVEIQTQGTQAFQAMTQAIRNANDANVITP